MRSDPKRQQKRQAAAWFDAWAKRTTSGPVSRIFAERAKELRRELRRGEDDIANEAKRYPE